MAKKPPVSKAEMEVLQVVWRLEPANARRVLEGLPSGRGLDFSTVQTYLSRLESKGYLQSELRGRVKFYQAKARPGQVIQETVDQFVDLVFGGESLPLMRHLIGQGKVSPAELAELKKLLDQALNQDPSQEKLT